MQDIYDQILAAKTPSVVRTDLRHESRKERAKAVRALFKSMGLKGISVTAPNYSMAQSIDICIPRDSYCDNPIHQDPSKNNSDCTECSRVWKAKQRLEPIILAAFPDLDNRSDSQSDHFDYCLSIH
jgi:hypothetical protein